MFLSKCNGNFKTTKPAKPILLVANLLMKVKGSIQSNHHLCEFSML